MKLLFTHKIMNLIGINNGCIHHAGCVDLALTSFQHIALRFFFNRFHLCQKLEFHSIVTGILCQRNRQTERADNAAARNIQRCYHGIFDIRLSFPYFVPADDRHTFYTVLYTFFIKRLQGRLILLCKAKDQGTISFIIEIQLFRKLLHHLTSQNVELCL